MRNVMLTFVAGLVLLTECGCQSMRVLMGRRTPYAPPQAYWRQQADHQLTADARAHWNYALDLIDVIAYSQDRYFEVPEPYDPTMFRRWVEKYGLNPVVLERVFGSFADDPDYGWPRSLRGVAWMYALLPYLFAAPSVAIIEPERTAEAAYVLREGIEMLRSPASWMDYAIIQGYGDPMRENMMWKGPLLISECLYTLVSGDRAYEPEIRAVARNLYETQQANLRRPLGKGYSGGVECEPNQWFPQCNSMGCLGLALYDKVFGPDPKYGLLIGEVYRTNYLRFIREYMSDPETGLVYRRWHPYGPQQVDPDLSGFANVFVALNLHAFVPEFAENIYRHIRTRYVRRLPFGLGAFMLEVPEKDIHQRVTNPGADQPGMLGETAANIALAWVASREFDDPATFDQIHRFLVNLMHPYYRQAEVRFDETNPEPSGLEGFTTGQLMNMFNGWWLFAKVHVGWKTILEHDWSRHRDRDGRPLGAVRRSR